MLWEGDEQIRNYNEDSGGQACQVTKEGIIVERRKPDETLHVDLELEALCIL